ncbi:MAG TPA: superoxide dismutase family protein [Rugosimonospora sp.]|nr:superoxide dismutase family protein [Rugosimonospora sp.]
MRRIVVGVLGLGVAGALAASGAAVAHMVAVGQRSSAHSASTVTKHGAGSTTTDRMNISSGVVGAGPAAGTGVKVVVNASQGNQVAEVDIIPLQKGGNLVTISAWGLHPGFHAIQLHSVGACDPGGNKPFGSAGGVLNPTGMRDTASAGAFPVLTVGSNGRGQARFVDGNFTLKDLSGKNGSSVVIHAVLPSGLTDNQATAKFADDSRARVACGVVFRSKARHAQTPATAPGPPMDPASMPPPDMGQQQPTDTSSTQAGHHW